MQAKYYGHYVSVVRRGAKNTRIRFESGRTKLVPNGTLRERPTQASVDP